mmetsp:Transcript_4205/g.10828  ORF Transcript_4205/g.10828 Transcript_4205/m.10828 type:complete len:241 (+) Transcript_4205:418-1140(+)
MRRVRRARGWAPRPTPRARPGHRWRPSAGCRQRTPRCVPRRRRRRLRQSARVRAVRAMPHRTAQAGRARRRRTHRARRPRRGRASGARLPPRGSRARSRARHLRARASRGAAPHARPRAAHPRRTRTPTPSPSRQSGASGPRRRRRAPRAREHGALRSGAAMGSSRCRRDRADPRVPSQPSRQPRTLPQTGSARSLPPHRRRARQRGQRRGWVCARSRGGRGRAHHPSRRPTRSIRRPLS